jgi:hypothetical protein
VVVVEVAEEEDSVAAAEEEGVEEMDSITSESERGEEDGYMGTNTGEEKAALLLLLLFPPDGLGVVAVVVLLFPLLLLDGEDLGRGDNLEAAAEVDVDDDEVDVATGAKSSSPSSKSKSLLSRVKAADEDNSLNSRSDRMCGSLCCRKGCTALLLPPLPALLLLLSFFFCLSLSQSAQLASYAMSQQSPSRWPRCSRLFLRRLRMSSSKRWRLLLPLDSTTHRFRI